MAEFVVFGIVLFALVLIGGPYLRATLAQNRELQNVVRSLQTDMAHTLREVETFKLISESASDGLVLQDMRGVVQWCNPAYCNVFGLTAEEIIGRNPMEFVLPLDQTPSQADIDSFRYDPNDPGTNGLITVENLRANGELFWSQLHTSFRVAADGKQYAILVCRDVTEQVEQEQRLRSVSAELEHEATHDGLTGVPNRGAFVRFVNKALSSEPADTIGLLHIDLDHFKDTNDTHGHSAGDAALKHTAGVLSDCLKAGDLVARIGGDEFVMVKRSCFDLASLSDKAAVILEKLRQPLEWNGKSLQIKASIGAALSTATTIDAEHLLSQADFALYEAKREGRDQMGIYDQNLREKRKSEAKKAAALSKAITDGTLEYVYQPSLDLETGHICGIEVLSRWRMPGVGIVPPLDFLPLVEEIGLMAQLDLRALDAAINKKQEIDALGLQNCKVAFNASPNL